ncbi:MAG: HipA family kinase [Sphingomonas bacterium]
MVTLQIDTLQILEVIQKADNGATEPFLCRLSDDQLYMVKGRSALAHGLIAETVCATLGHAVGLPIPDFAIASIESEQTRFNAEARRSLGVGWVFASKYHDNLVQVGRSNIEHFSNEILRKIFIFDLWIRNEDRTGTFWGGNSNVFMDVMDKSLVMFDHNLAFDRSFAVQKFVDLHICRDFWFSDGKGLLDRAYYVDMFQQASELLPILEEAIPDDWLEESLLQFEDIGKTLRKVQEDDFWEAVS